MQHKHQFFHQKRSTLSQKLNLLYHTEEHTHSESMKSSLPTYYTLINTKLGHIMRFIALKRKHFSTHFISRTSLCACASSCSFRVIWQTRKPFSPLLPPTGHIYCASATKIKFFGIQLKVIVYHTELLRCRFQQQLNITQEKLILQYTEKDFAHLHVGPIQYFYFCSNV